MKQIILISFFLIGYSSVNAQLTATTPSGKKVILNADHTWKEAGASKGEVEIPDYLKKFIGTWDAYYTVSSEVNDKIYGHQKISETKPSLLFDIAYQNSKIKIRSCRTGTKEGVYYFGKYSNGKIACTGFSADRFYKYQIPEFKTLQNGELMYSDGEGDYVLKHSSTPIDNVKRTYTLLNPVNGD